ncbi:MAG: YceI family protein [Bacteroidia bacterium]|nr:YceI family protein [Bacteroidia bacterium]
MKKLMNIAIALLFAIAANAQTWTVDKAHAKLGFTITHLLISDVEGSFKSFEAKITSSKDDFSDAVFELTANVSSISTDNERRDAHLSGADFFDVVNYPTLVFKSKTFTKVEGKQYKLTGDLTMHGVTKPVELFVVLNGLIQQPNGVNRIAGFKATGKLNRKDFGIAPSTPAAILSDEVMLTANGEFQESKSGTN